MAQGFPWAFLHSGLASLTSPPFAGFFRLEDIPVSISLSDSKDRLLSRPEAATWLGLSPYTLNEWASTGRYGLRYYRIGRKCMYRLSDLQAFIASRAVHPL
ncbi:helix-turn-helix domain-containing protein [Chromobacterium vaccinii]|uniref:helix-turn-helix domain-containing protein n=1 Tax=Chromobacterium vaccinii TaxID=1108595 RepID=UPI000E1FCA85